VTLEEFRNANVLPTKKLLEVVVEKGIQLKRFIYISSQAAAGAANSLDHPITELCKPEPIEAYGKSKLEAEYIVQEYADQVPFTILRPSAVYGPRDLDFLNIFKLITNRLSIYPGCRDKFISILFVKDLVNGIIQAARAPNSKGKKYFLSSDEPVRWSKIHGIIAKVADKTVVDINIPHWIINFVSKFGNIYSKLTGKYSLINSQKIALSKPNYWVCSPQLAKIDFDFETHYSLEDGLKKTYHWYSENRSIN
jgi:nucleoside-diphosphate-sugar epimerase